MKKKQQKQRPRVRSAERRARHRSLSRDTRIATKDDIIICVLLACLMLLVYMALVEYTSFANLYSGVGCVMVYLLVLTLHAAYRLHSNPVVLDNTMLALLGSPLGQLVGKLHSPVMICDEFGNLCWYNEMVAEWIQENGVRIGSSVNSLLSVEENKRVRIGERIYSFDAVATSSEDGNYVFIILTDCTELVDLEKKYYDERVAVALVTLDNIEEVMQYFHANFRDAVAGVDEMLRHWADSHGGIIKSYDNDKYIMFFDSEHVTEFVENRFEILDRIRSIHIGDGISVTISMGVSHIAGTLAERQSAAQAALDLALQRGGDQAVYKTETDVQYYGGRTKAAYKRTNVKAQLVARQLYSLIGRADNVIIMGHSFGDFDSIGSCVGMARICMSCGVQDILIAVDDTNQNIKYSFEKARELSDYQTLFVSEKEALEQMTQNTLLIVCDVNNLKHTEYPALVDSAKQVAIVDHHIQTREFPPKVRLAYIEPSASSASELITELIEYGLTNVHLRKEEAELLLAGILLDTKHFTRNTGTRTFAAARYLRGEGADPAEAEELFRVDADTFYKEARFISEMEIYRGNIAISCIESGTDPSYRVVAAQAADKMLSINRVEAAFALVRIENTTYISARSSGTINVQRILEAEGLKGGGHFDVAGAQVANETVKSVRTILQDSIDAFLTHKS